MAAIMVASTSTLDASVPSTSTTTATAPPNESKSHGPECPPKNLLTKLQSLLTAAENASESAPVPESWRVRVTALYQKLRTCPPRYYTPLLIVFMMIAKQYEDPYFEPSFGEFIELLLHIVIVTPCMVGVMVILLTAVIYLDDGTVPWEDIWLCTSGKGLVSMTNPKSGAITGPQSDASTVVPSAPTTPVIPPAGLVITPTLKLPPGLKYEYSSCPPFEEVHKSGILGKSPTPSQYKAYKSSVDYHYREFKRGEAVCKEVALERELEEEKAKENRPCGKVRAGSPEAWARMRRSIGLE